MAETSDVVSSFQSQWLRFGEIALAVVLLALVALAARAQTFGNPLLGFDEQFYLLVGDRMLHGALPFVDIFDRKPIGLFLLYEAIRLIGGEGTLQYQLVACGFAFATALLIWRFARRLTGKIGALAAGIAYLLWLNFLGGEGGQAPVFYNLLVAAAAMLTARAIERGCMTVGSGAAPLLLVGLAMQIKYTALFEGALFGSALLWTLWSDRREPLRIAGLAAAWIATAILPTLIAFLYYAARGEAHAFVFANFISMFGKLPDPITTSAAGFLKIIAILSPLLACAVFPPPAADGSVANRQAFLRWWLLAALAGMLAMGSFPATHYALPVLVPVTIAAAPRLEQLARSRIVLWGALFAAFAGGQLLLRAQQRSHGTTADAVRLATNANPGSGSCLYVYDGYPALYRLTGSCLPTRYAFPGHLDTANEANSAGLGIEPTAEVRRIMATRPAVVVLEDPPFERVNRATYAIVRAALGLHYRRTFDLVLGQRHRLVFRRAEERN